jgi:hypothetical protein
MLYHMLLLYLATHSHSPSRSPFPSSKRGCYTPDLHQDTQFLLSASLVNRSWSSPAQILLFRHVVICTPTAFTPLYNAISSNEPRGKHLARHVRSLSATLDAEQLQSLSFARAVSLFPDQTTLDLASFSHSKHAQPFQRDTKPFLILDDEEVSILRTGPLITCLRLANWSDDSTLLSKRLSLCHTSLRTLSLHGGASVPCFFPTTSLTLVAG